MRSKHTLHIMALFLSLTWCFMTSACQKPVGRGESATASPSSSPTAATDAADYIGLYQLTGHEDDAPFTLAEIPEDDSGYIYMYDGESLVAKSCIDYSEQRALNGNPLMVISFVINDAISEIGIFASFFDGQTELHMRGYDDLEGFEGVFKKIDGTMFLQSEDKESDYLLNELQAAGYDLEGAAVITEDGDKDAVMHGKDLSKWILAWGKNTVHKFTTEKHFAVTASRPVWEYDVLSHEWIKFN